MGPVTTPPHSPPGCLHAFQGPWALARPAPLLPPPGPSAKCLWSLVKHNSLHLSFPPVPGPVVSSWGHLGLAWAPGRLPRTPHLIRKQRVIPAILLGLQRLPWCCPWGRQQLGPATHSAGSHAHGHDMGQGPGQTGEPLLSEPAPRSWACRHGSGTTSGSSGPIRQAAPRPSPPAPPPPTPVRVSLTCCSHTTPAPGLLHLAPAPGPSCIPRPFSLHTRAGKAASSAPFSLCPGPCPCPLRSFPRRLSPPPPLLTPPHSRPFSPANPFVRRTRLEHPLCFQHCSRSWDTLVREKGK